MTGRRFPDSRALAMSSRISAMVWPRDPVDRVRRQEQRCDAKRTRSTAASRADAAVISPPSSSGGDSSTWSVPAASAPGVEGFARLVSPDKGEIPDLRETTAQLKRVRIESVAFRCVQVMRSSALRSAMRRYAILLPSRRQVPGTVFRFLSVTRLLRGAPRFEVTGGPKAPIAC